jgi:hypothetical protein
MAKGYKTGGRRKGTLNRLTVDLREMILGALVEAGGRDYLVAQAHKNPKAFMALLGKLLPAHVAGGDEGPIEAEVELSDVEVARRLAFLLARGAQAPEGPQPEPLGASQPAPPQPAPPAEAPRRCRDRDLDRAGASPSRVHPPRASGATASPHAGGTPPPHRCDAGAILPPPAEDGRSRWRRRAFPP